MHILWKPHGRGSAKAAAAYLLAPHDHLGRKRASVRVLRGSPDLVAAVADSLPYVWRYSSAVVAWAPEDAPTPEQIDLVLRDFSRLAFAGLEDRVAWAAVQHEDDGGVHVHILVARADLKTLRSFNPAPPGWQKAYDLLRDAFNAEFGWADPSDPARARPVQPGYEALVDAAKIRAGLEPTSAKRQISAWILERIEAGLIASRDDIVASLAELGEITRIGDDYISVKPVGFKRAIRLKGTIYGKHALERSLREAGPKARGRSAEDRGVDFERARRVRQKLEEAVRRRAAYNAHRYGAPDQAFERVPGEHEIGDRDAAEGAEPSLLDHQAAGAGGNSLAGSRGGLDGAAVWGQGSNAEAGGFGTRDSGAGAGAGELAGQNSGSGDIQGQQWHLFSSPAGGGRLQLENWLAACREAWKRLRRGKNERDRGAIGGRLAASLRAVRRGLASSRAADLSLASASAGLERAAGKLDQICRKADAAYGVLKMAIDAELERFKSEINLVEYAAAQGYAIDHKESSKASIVMRRERDDDKIIVATDADGHGIYFSVRDNSDNGTIIDFVQKRTGYSLGRVRKELRPWIGVGPIQIQAQRRPQAERPPKPVPSSADRQRVMINWMRMRAINGRHPYLEKRGLLPETLSDPRFANMIRDFRGHATFPHYDRLGLAGFEIKGEGFTGFSAGGQKALWYSTNAPKASRLIVVESAIDAMSHAQIFGDAEAGYISTGGSLSSYQRDLLQGVLAKAAERGVQIVIATDSDDGGRRLADEIARLAPPGAVVQRQEPESKDWNDLLRERLREQAEQIDRPMSQGG